MNEADVSLRWAMASLNIFFVAAIFLFYFGVGSYHSAVEGAHHLEEGEDGDQDARADDNTIDPSAASKPQEQEEDSHMAGIASDSVAEDTAADSSEVKN